MANLINADNGLVSGSVGLKYSCDNTGVLALQTSGNTVMTIDGSGNVGIGTTTPGRILDIQSASPSAQILATTGTNRTWLRAVNTSGNFYFGIDSSTGGVFGTAYARVLYGDGAYPMTFYTNATERMRISSSGQIGIGTNIPSQPLDVVVSGTGDQTIIGLRTTGGGGQGMLLGVNTTNTVTTIKNNTGSGYGMAFYSGSGSTEHMRITSGGDLLVGTSTVGMVNGGIQSQPNGNTTNVPFLGCAGNSSSGSHLSYGLYSTSLSQYQFYVGYNGTIAARSTSITGLSDISEKENIQPLETGLNEVLALQPRRFDWKNGSGQNVAGFVAQEVEAVLPDLVEEYRVDEETTKKGLKMGDMIPTLVKAIQEQQAMIEELKAEVALLKSKE